MGVRSVLLLSRRSIIQSWRPRYAHSLLTLSPADSPGIEHQGKIHLDLSKSYERPWLNTVVSGAYEPVPIGIVIKVGSEKGILIAEALYGKTVVGTARIDYTKTNARRPVR